jgi:hypothetical protein
MQVRGITSSPEIYGDEGWDGQPTQFNNDDTDIGLDVCSLPASQRLSSGLANHPPALEPQLPAPPLCQTSCRLNRIGTIGGAGRRKWHDTGQAYKDRIVPRLLPPESAAVEPPDPG